MPDALTQVYLGYGARASMAIIVGALLLSFHARYRRPHLQLWGLSWLSFSVHLLASAVVIWFAYALVDSPEPSRAATALSQGAGYLYLTLLIGGVWALLGRRIRVVRTLWISTAAALVVGIALALMFSEDSIGRIWTSVVLFDFAVATVSLFCGFLVAELARKTQGLGLRLMSASFLTYGVVIGMKVILSGWELLTATPVPVIEYFEFVDFLYIVALGAGMTVSLLEEERQASHRALSEVEHLTYHDILTGLPNRYQFVDRMIVTTAKTEDPDVKFGVFLIDVDGFKRINDSLGHTIGDALLREVAERLSEATGERGLLARFGADEFAYVREVTGVRDVAEQAAALLETISSAPIAVAGRDLYVTLSIGVGVWPESGSSIEELLGAADLALYKAKERGRDRFMIHSSDLDDESRDRLAIESDLRSALQNGEMFLSYQPIRSLLDGEVVAVEALIRWNHPDHGHRSPSEFVPVAEQTNLIHEIGFFVLERACVEAGHLRNASGAPLGISVNFSPRQLGVREVAQGFAARLQQYGIDPARVSLEITEHELMRDVESAIAALVKLREIGVQIAVDDFGTGYSSLEYLKRLPVDALKIDRAFVRDIPRDTSDSAIAAAVVALARSLGLEVIAEGIETSAQHEFLRDSGCTLGQGFHLGEPMTAAELERFLGSELANGVTRAETGRAGSDR